MNKKDVISIYASDVMMSEVITTRRPYMEVEMRMFTTRVNKNDDRVTEAFIDDIIANADEYTGTPLCADLTR